jgi:hypothetical protein
VRHELAPLPSSALRAPASALRAPAGEPASEARASPAEPDG